MILKTKIKDLLLIQSETHKDQRGYFKELLKENLIKKKFPFLVMSFSKKNVIRGLHIQTYNSQGKYVSVLKGKIFDVAVDLRKNSKTFGKTFKTILSEKNSKSIYIPPGFAHGFCALEKENYIIYSCTKYRDAKSEKGIFFNDKYLNIKDENLINYCIAHPYLTFSELSKYNINKIGYTTDPMVNNLNNFILEIRKEVFRLKKSNLKMKEFFNVLKNEVKYKKLSFLTF